MTYAELFAGAGGMSMGLKAGGFHSIAHAEIEPHARAVLREHWPDVRLDYDVTAVRGADYSGVTLLSGSSPCQDFSVAGKRTGLGGARSSLFYQQARIWRESGSPYLLWENVYGALSSNGGKDFALVLSTLVGAAITVPTDGWRRGGVAAGRDAVASWRVLDLQHFGPPQRRVRVFVLAARAGGVDPAEVLALSEGVCGHPSPRDVARKDVTGTISSRTRGGGGLGTDFDLSGGVVAFHHAPDPISGDVSPSFGRTTNGMGVVCTAGDITHALTHEGADASEDGTGRGTPIVVGNSGMESWRMTDVGITLAARDAKGGNNVVVGPLDFGGHGGSYNGQDAYQNRIRADYGRPRRLALRGMDRAATARRHHLPGDHMTTPTTPAAPPAEPKAIAEARKRVQWADDFELTEHYATDRGLLAAYDTLLATVTAERAALRLTLLDEWRVVDEKNHSVYGTFSTREYAQFYADGTSYRVVQVAILTPTPRGTDA